ncbi:glutathione ABC transporter substrate-binding protein [Paenalkalicoccus suaedae]|uniref:Glutathione ABC transporter substrate-binding protein n=2 Tax=Paenalkalicoccus suaedae TaxID=2592382 RepID=A0A859FKF4_9BACI|nr:glutathione ABC transporter substrate-binding protein [Paenalkalicoccus suaedae]QKS73277.1 glutathione ABC transporter substrate-binding protein [Paenalkalicoccus suaedae]
MVGLSALALLAACASEPNNDGTTNDQLDTNANDSATTIEGGNEDFLQVGLMSNPVSLDPHGANENVSNSINTNIYDRLVYTNQDLEITPGLASSFEQVEDTVWEATIREGVTFHDGEELNAEVVKQNFDRILDPAISSPIAFIFDMIEEVRVVDEYTVEFETAFPFASLPSHMAHPGGSIISPAIIEQSYEDMENGGQPFDAANENPIGTGFFQFEEYQPGNFVELSKNENYWDESDAQVDGVTFRIVPEGLTRIAELETETLDIIYPVNPGDVTRLEEAEGVGVYQAPSTRMAYLGFNTEVEPFNDPLVRRAIHMALNKEDLIEGVLDGTGSVANSPIAPDVFGYSEDLEPIDYDLDEARELLAEAGYEDGFQTTLLTDDDREREDSSQLIQAQLAEIGIDVEIEMVEFGVYLERAGAGETDMFVGSWGTVTMDADYGLYPVFHSSNKGSAGNRSYYENDEVDALLVEARQSSDDAERLALYEEAQQLIIEDSPYAFMYYPDLITGLNDDVEGFWQLPSSFLYLRDVSLNR